MSTTLQCPKCGTSVDLGDRFDGLCPACLYQQLVAAPTLEGSDLGNYSVLGLLGSGGMGAVYRARQKGLERDVALKVLASSGPEEIERFFREARAAARLRHPNIVSIHEVSSAKGRYFFTMDLVDGLTLEGPLEPRRAAEVVRTVARAVQHAHDQGVIHRDLKPANILVDAKGEPQVMDFGLAKVVRGGKTLTASDIIMGTPAYMSPEQASGDRLIDARTDVYSLGAVLYEALTGEPPFKGKTPLQTVNSVLRDEPASPRSRRDGIDRDLETICLKALEKDRDRRYPTAAELADDLDRWLKQEPIRASRAGVVRRFAGSLRRRPAAWAVAAGFLVLCGLAAGVIQAFYTFVWPFVVEQERQREVSEKVDPLLTQARDLLRNHKAERAMEEIEKVLRLQPSNATALSLRGFAHEHLGKTDKAIADYQRATKLESRLPDPWYRLFWLLAKQDVYNLDSHMGYCPPERDALIRRSYEALSELTLKPDQVECARAMWAFREGFAPACWGEVSLDVVKPDVPGLRALFREIIDHLDKALAHNELNVEALDFRALVQYLWAVMKVDDPEVHLLGGLADADRALEIEPRNAYVLYEKAAILARLGRRGEALAVAGKMIEIYPGTWDVQLFNGLVQSALGEDKAALAAFDAAGAAGGDRRVLHMVRAMHFLGWHGGTPGVKPSNPIRILQASEEIRRLLEEDPAHVPGLIFSAFFKLNAGNREGGLADLDRAAAVSPGNPILRKIRAAVER